jgi:hypothetical protein
MITTRSAARRPPRGEVRRSADSRRSLLDTSEKVFMVLRERHSSRRTNCKHEGSLRNRRLITQAVWLAPDVCLALGNAAGSALNSERPTTTSHTPSPGVKFIR